MPPPLESFFLVSTKQLSCLGYKPNLSYLLHQSLLRSSQISTDFNVRLSFLFFPLLKIFSELFFSAANTELSSPSQDSFNLQDRPNIGRCRKTWLDTFCCLLWVLCVQLRRSATAWSMFVAVPHSFSGEEPLALRAQVPVVPGIKRDAHKSFN